MYDPKKCVGCMRCADVCPNGCHTVGKNGHVFKRDLCVSCGDCISPLCDALELSGKDVSAEEILTEVLKDKAFYDSSGGGLTLSGGEPLAQGEFCIELMKKAKAEGLHICMETCGYSSPELMARAAELVDVFLFDYKETDPTLHRDYTGADSKVILDNLALLDRMKKQVVLRCPIIPTLNDRVEHILGIAHTANRFSCISEIVIEPYHTLGMGKYLRLGTAYELTDISEPSDEDIDSIISMLKLRTSVKISKA